MTRTHELPATGEPDPHAVFEAALSGASVLNGAQRANARAKVADLLERRTVWESTPFRLILEANRRCNISCSMCDIRHLKEPEMPEAQIEALFEEIGAGLFEVQPFGAGEPTLSPIDLIARLARKYNNYLSFITNGILFDAAYYRPIADITSRVQFSLHSHLPKVAERIAVGQSFEHVVKNLKDVVEIGREHQAHIMCNAVVMDSNFSTLPEYIRFLAGLGVKRTCLTRLYPTSAAYAKEGIEVTRSPAEIEDQMAVVLNTAVEHGIFVESNFPSLVHDARNKETVPSRFDIMIDNAHIVKLFGDEACVATAISAFVEYDGTVLPCFQHRIPLGNLNDGNFDAAWNGERMQQHRVGFLDDTLQNYCRICRVFFCKKEGIDTSEDQPWLNRLQPNEKAVVDLIQGQV